MIVQMSICSLDARLFLKKKLQIFFPFIFPFTFEMGCFSSIADRITFPIGYPSVNTSTSWLVLRFNKRSWNKLWNKKKQDNTRQDKTRQDKTRQDKKTENRKHQHHLPQLPISTYLEICSGEAIDQPLSTVILGNKGTKLFHLLCVVLLRRADHTALDVEQSTDTVSGVLDAITNKNFTQIIWRKTWQKRGGGNGPKIGVLFGYQSCPWFLLLACKRAARSTCREATSASSPASPLSNTRDRTCCIPFETLREDTCSSKGKHKTKKYF